MGTEIVGQVWNVLNALVFPLVGVVFYMLRQQNESQFSALRELLSQHEKQREKFGVDITARVAHIERDFHDFKISAAKTYITEEDIKNVSGELREVQRKLEATAAQMHQLNLDWTREIHKCRENCKP